MLVEETNVVDYCFKITFESMVTKQ